MNHQTMIITIPTKDLNSLELIKIINKEFTKLKLWDVEKLDKLHTPIKKIIKDHSLLNDKTALSIFKVPFDIKLARKIIAGEFSEDENYLVGEIINMPKEEIKIMDWYLVDCLNIEHVLKDVANAIQKYKSH